MQAKSADVIPESVLCGVVRENDPKYYSKISMVCPCSNLSHGTIFSNYCTIKNCPTVEKHSYTTGTTNCSESVSKPTVLEIWEYAMLMRQVYLLCLLIVLAPSIKEYNYRIHTIKQSLSLTKFIANNISICVQINLL